MRNRGAQYKDLLRSNYKLLLMVFFAFFLMIVVSYFSISNVMQQQLQASADQNLKVASSSIETIMTEPEITMINASMIVTEMLEEKATPEEMQNYFVVLTSWLLEHDGEISGFNGMYGYFYDTFMDGLNWVPPEGYVPEERPWYVEAINGEGSIVFTDPYIDEQTKEMVVTAAQALYDQNGNLYGVLALDMQMGRIADYVDSLKLAENGYGLLFDENLNIIAHPKNEFLSRNLLEDFPGMSEEVEQAASVEAGAPLVVDYVDAEGVDKLLFLEKMERGWYVGLIFPVSEYYTPIYHVLVILSVLGLILMVILDIALMRLVEQKQRSDEESKSKSTFLATMSHEIRTPMNAILGMSEIALREPLLTPALNEHLMSIRQASRNLLSLINDILDFSKIEADKLELNRAPYSFSSLVNDVISVAYTRLAEKPMLFVTNIDSAIPHTMVGDELRIRQIMLNLLSNAVKYTEEGYVSLTIGYECMTDNSVELVIEVSDSGYGIKEEDQELLFDVFTKIENSKTHNVEGTGLGLTITRNLCQLMGGTIEVYSQYGVGSTFTARIPQTFESYEKVAQVFNPKSKAVLVCESREIYANSIVCAIDNLDVDCTLVTNQSDLLRELNKKDYTHVFAASFSSESVKNTLSRAQSEAQLVLLAEYGEVLVDSSVQTLAMPAYSVSVANILNGHVKNTDYDGMINTYNHFEAETACVLVVDDVKINLKVVSGLLAPYRMRVDGALSGQEAIDLIRDYHYDLVFMDHMMPEMDGIETVQKIRELPAPDNRYKELPIVALTANAMTGMREMFLSNGFDDYLPKPIDVTQLHATLETWIPKEKQTDQKGLPPARIDQNISIMGVDSLRGIAMTGGDVDNYLSTLSVFLEDGKEKLVQLKECLVENDLTNFTISVHALKSASASIGAAELSDQARLLELAGKDKDIDTIDRLTGRFFTVLAAVLESIESYLEENVREGLGKEEIDEDKDYLFTKLNELRVALASYDNVTSDKVVKELSLQQWTAATQEKLDAITKNILLFEYDEVNRIIDKLLEQHP